MSAKTSRTYKIYGDAEPSAKTILDLGDDVYVVSSEDGETTVSIRRVSDHVVLMQMADGQNFEVPWYQDGNNVTVELGGRVYSFEVLDQMQAVLKERRSGGAAGDGAINVAMPGRVIKLLVQEGDSVEAGQGVVIVEAMKMENELKSPVSGTVAQIKVAVGDVVDAGDLLIKVEPDEA